MFGGALDSPRGRQTHHAHATSNILVDYEHNHQDITYISVNAKMSNEGPEFKNEDVKEKLEGKSDFQRSSFEHILMELQRRSSRWTW